jgi:zinc transport system permease protein
MNAVLEMVQMDFMRNVLIGTALVGALCAYLGVFVVLRRAVFVGAALAQTSSLGVAMSYFACGILGTWLGRDIHIAPQPVALLLTLAVSALMAVQQRERRLPRETVVGVIYVAASALAILVVAMSAHVHAEVLNLLFGNVLAISTGAVIGMSVLAVLVGVMHLAAHRFLVFTSFDPVMATAVGLRAWWWNLGLFLVIGLVISVSINVAGALVVFGLLVIPPSIALVLGVPLRWLFLVSTLMGIAVCLGGVTISYVADWPTGPTIVSLATALLGLAYLTRLRSAL